MLLGALTMALGAGACTFDGGGPGIAPSSDGPSITPDRGPSDGPLPDSTDLYPWPDAAGADSTADSLPRPDTSVDLGFGVFLDEEFRSGQGDVSFEQGSWVWSPDEGGTITQETEATNGNYALFDAPNGLMAAESLLRVNALATPNGKIMGAAIGFRVHAPTVVGAAPQMVACYLSPNTNALGIMSCDGTTVHCNSSNSTTFSAKVGFNYRIHGEISETPSGEFLLSCEVVGQNVTVSQRIGPGAGDIALVTFYADVTFFSFKVYQP